MSKWLTRRRFLGSAAAGDLVGAGTHFFGPTILAAHASTVFDESHYSGIDSTTTARDRASAVKRQFGQQWTLVRVGVSGADWRATCFATLPYVVLPVMLIARDKYVNQRAVATALSCYRSALHYVHAWYGRRVGTTFRLLRPLVIPTNLDSAQWNAICERTRVDAHRGALVDAAVAACLQHLPHPGDKPRRFGCMLNMLLAAVALGAVGYVLWEKYQQRQLAVNEAVTRGVSAGRAIIEGETKAAVNALREAAHKSESAGRQDLAALLRDAVDFVDKARVASADQPSGLLNSDSCRELLVKEDPGIVQAVYQHPKGVVNVMIVALADKTSDRPLVERSGDGWGVGWSKRIPAGTYYLCGVMTTAKAADEVAAWFDQPERLPAPEFRIAQSLEPASPDYAIANPLRKTSPPKPPLPTPKPPVGGQASVREKTVARATDNKRVTPRQKQLLIDGWKALRDKDLDAARKSFRRAEANGGLGANEARLALEAAGDVEALQRKPLFLICLEPRGVSSWGLSHDKSSKFGFINGDGRIVIQPVWDDAFAFEEGRAWVKKDEKVGFIDRDGKVVISPEWDQATSFQEGRAAVKKNDKWGFVDRQGNIVIKPTWDRDKHHGPKLGRFREGLASVERQGKHGFINWYGTLVIPPTWEAFELIGFNEGLVPAKKDGKWGLIDNRGNVVAAPTWDSVWTVSEGRAMVRKNKKMGFLDENGKVVVLLVWDRAAGFHEGLAAVSKGKQWGFINTAGKIIIEPAWDSVQAFSEGLALVKTHDKWGFIAKDGKVVRQPTWDLGLGGRFHEGLLRVGKEMKYGFIDRQGKVVIESKWFGSAPRFTNGLVAVYEKQPSTEAARMCYLDRRGKVVWNSKCTPQRTNSAR